MGKDLQCSETPKISIIIPFAYCDSSRQKAAILTIECLEQQEFKDFELIVSEEVYGNRPLFPYEVDNHIVLSGDDRPFNKSWCINSAVKKAKTNNLLVLDADIKFSNDYLRKFFDNIKKHPKFFMGWNRIILEKGRDNPHGRIGTLDIHKAAGGCWYINKDFFWSLGGMNEKYFGHGAEDNDIWERINYIIKERPFLEYDVVHTYHHWHRVDSKFPLNPDRVKLLNETLANIPLEIERLKSKELGGDRPNP